MTLAVIFLFLLPRPITYQPLECCDSGQYFLEFLWLLSLTLLTIPIVNNT